MKNAQKPDHVSLSTLLNWLREGRYVVPDFQREFEWQPWDIRDLVRSIFLDYYIGSLLLWKGKKENFTSLSCEAIYGFEGNSRPESIVLDGQQRLTAMYYAFVAPKKKLPNRASQAVFYVRIDRFAAEDHDDAFHYDYVSKRLEAKFSDQKVLFAEHIFPCAVIGAGGFDMFKWIESYKQYWKDRVAEATATGNETAAQLARLHADQAVEFGNHLLGITQEYQISYIELDQDLELDKVCDIFTKLNSKGVRLDVFDLLNALLKPKHVGLKHMWREVAPRLDFADSEKMNVYVLQVMSILRQDYCSPKYLYFLIPGEEKPIRDPDGTRRRQVLVENASVFRDMWHAAVVAMEEAIRLLRHPQEFSAKYLPYVSILPVFAALQAHLQSCPAHFRFNGQRKIRQWYWSSVFANHYSGSVESTSTRDFLDVKAWIESDDAEPALVRDFKLQLNTLMLGKETNSGSSIYNGVFNLLILAGARDWMTGTIPHYDQLDDHHIVPASWGAKHLGSNLVHTILNRTPLSADTNRRLIRERLPCAYLPELIERNGEANVCQTLESHFISPAAFAILLRDPFTATDFDHFIVERKRAILEAIERILLKEHIELPPKLKELDADVESIELGLRRLIDEVLDGDESLVPPHVAQKVTDRIRSAERKNPGLDAQRYASLSGRLEYFDLRELQEIIVGKATWLRFEPQFSTKEGLITKSDRQ